MSIEILSKDVLIKIFLYLDDTDLCTINKLNKYFNNISSNKIIWLSNIYKRFPIFKEIDLDTFKYYKRHRNNKQYYIYLTERLREINFNDNNEIIKASKLGRPDILRILLKNKNLDPSYQDNLAICWASLLGFTEIMKILLNDERIDPSYIINEPLIMAKRRKHNLIVEMILKDYRVRQALNK